MTISDIKSQLSQGVKFSFSGSTSLEVESNDGTTLVAKVMGGPRDGQQMIWTLEGLDQIDEVTR